MTKSEQTLEDFQFIIDELNRQSKWSFADFKQHWEKHPEDKYDVLPLKNGSHICANAAVGQRFRDLAERNSESDQERNSYDRASFVDALKRQFVHHFVELGRQLDQAAADKLVGKALSNLKKQRKEITHFVPCEITSLRWAQEFQIGNVKFYPMTAFRDMYMETIRSTFDQRNLEIEVAWKRNEETGKKPLFPTATLEGTLTARQQLQNEFEDFYNRLGWIAEITVPPCLPDISFARATETVNAALDVLKLFLGPDAGKSFRIAYDKGFSPRSSLLTRDEVGEFHTTWTIGGYGALTSENWYEDLRRLFPMELQVTGITVNHLLNPKRATPLFEKWLGALLWYGQGVSENNYGAKIVKYVAALEQLTVAKKSSDLDITKTVTLRTKFLCRRDNENIDDMENTNESIDKLYGYRSDLMHGQLSPSSPKIHDIAKRSGKIVQHALFAALHMFVYLATDKRDSLKELEKEYRLHVQR